MGRVIVLFGRVGSFEPPGPSRGRVLTARSLRHELGAVDPLSGLDEQFLLLAAEDADPDDLGRAQGHLAAAAGAAPDVAVVADVADAVRELGLQADLARGHKLLATHLAQLGAALPDGVFEELHLVLLAPAPNKHRETEDRLHSPCKRGHREDFIQHHLHV